MAIKGGLPVSFKQEILDGVHDAGDEYKIALFTDAANLGAGTRTYSPQGEIAENGNGYKAGGVALSGRKCGVSGSSGYVTFDDPQWLNATFTARGALIYNASKGNRAVGIINFGQDHTCTNGTFKVTLPPAGQNAIISVG